MASAVRSMTGALPLSAASPATILETANQKGGSWPGFRALRSKDRDGGNFAGTDACPEDGAFPFGGMVSGATVFSVIVAGDAGGMPPIPLRSGFPLFASGQIGMGLVPRRLTAS